METQEKKAKAPKAEMKRFVVKTKGYSETFDSIDKARGQYDVLKKRSIKAQEATKIQIFEKEKNELKEVDSINITEDFFRD